jgi:site-specific recombinase XerD
MAEISPLRRRMIEDMTVRNLSPATQQSYLHAVSKFSRHFGQSPDRLGLEEVHAFQLHLVATGVSWPSLNQIVCALRFFYGVTLGQDTLPERIAHAREPSKLPVVLSAEEVVRFLETIPSLKSRTALTTVYAAGLRVSEVVLLKIADIDSRWRHGRNPRRTLVRRHVLETAESGCGGRVSANTESSGIASIRVFHSLRDPAAGTLLKARFGRQPMSRGG